MKPFSEGSESFLKKQSRRDPSRVEHAIGGFVITASSTQFLFNSGV